MMVQEARPSCGADEQSNKQLLSVSRVHRFHRGGEGFPWIPPWAASSTSSPLNQPVKRERGGACYVVNSWPCPRTRTIGGRRNRRMRCVLSV